MNTGATVIPADVVERMIEIDEQVHTWRVLEYNASRANDARGVGNCGRALEALWGERDGLAAANPGADFEARRRAAVRRMSH